MDVLAERAVVEREHDRLRRERRSTQPVLVHLMKRDGVEAVRSQPAHLRGEVGWAHEEVRKRDPCGRHRNHVVHEDRHRTVVSPSGGVSADACKEKDNGGEDRRRVR